MVKIPARLQGTCSTPMKSLQTITMTGTKFGSKLSHHDLYNLNFSVRVDIDLSDLHAQ